MGKDKSNEINNKKEEKQKHDIPLKAEPPGFFSRLLYCWIMPLYYFGMKRDLEEYDLVPAKKLYESKTVSDALERKWNEEEIAAKAAGRPPSLKRVLIKTYGLSFIPGGIMQFISVGTRTLSPLLFAKLLEFWSPDSSVTREEAVWYASGMIIANWIASFFASHGNFYCQQFGMKLRVAASSLMFRKLMKINNASLGETAAGKVVNILSNDMQRFDLAMLFLHYVWIIPIQLAAVSYLGYMQAGVASFIGLAALIIVALPIQGYLSQIIGNLRFRIAEKTDERIKVMTEVVSGIQVIKMYAWEIPFQKIVGEKRVNELKHVRVASLLRAVFIGFMVFTERIALFITILALVLFGNSMTANVIYPLQQFMTAAQLNITFILPLVLAFTAELFVSIKRIEEFLTLEDRTDLSTSPVGPPEQTLFRDMSTQNKNPPSVRPLSYEKSSNPDLLAIKELITPKLKGRQSLSQPGSDVAIELRNVTASWTGDPNYCAIKNVSMRVRRGKLCAIIGAVGSGKSSILHLLLKELQAASGSVSVSGSMSYASQEPWLFPSSVRDNIIFGLPYDPEKYKKIIKACCLEKDFTQFPYGDQTLVGEKGVSLSGGQRARINLARAVYRESDICLLDDPLSAVDANVGRLLFEGCINGLLLGKTRVLVTHQIHFLKAADFIVVLNEGSIENMGTFEELVSYGKEFSTMLASLQEGKDRDRDSVGSGTSMEEKEKAPLKRSLSVVTDDDEPDEYEAQRMVDEERASGNLRWEVIASYFKAGGSSWFITLTAMMILLTAMSAGAVDYWVSYWTNNMAIYTESLAGANPDPGLHVQVGSLTTAQFLMVHAGLVLACTLLTNLRVFPFVAICIDASKNLHNFMFSTMIKGIMRFFDTSSSGRILNRFTKDVGALDEILPRTLLDVVQIYSTLLIILVLNAIALYWTIIPSIGLLIIFALFVRVYMKTAQSIKRLEGTTKSPVFGMVTSALNGIATIRSCGSEKNLIKEFDKHQDLHTAAWNSYLCGGVSFGLYMDTLCLIYLGIVIFVFIYVDFGDALPVGSVGLAVTQSNTLTAMLQHGARMLVEFIAQLTSVERVLDYTKIETEENLFEGKIPVMPTWPTQGNIVFDNVNLRYAPNEEPVLRNLNIVIEEGWKVGIVGRTGAGKSSLISALFRFAYIDGNITIDGIDTALVARQNLRSKISIIPQEPVLFSATIRYNLDPFGIYSDADLWKALEQVDMTSGVQSLDFKVTEGGANFSVGQRQLLCLARAVLRTNKILIMDEATANVDPQTDGFIQKTIRSHFTSCTVLTIAHRLNTVMDSDKVMVMDAGQVAEFDHPYILLSDPNSQLSSMTKETGEKSAAQLFNMAKEAYFQSNMKENLR